MKINKIVIKNFGSYEGTTNFETKTQNERNIILIGGKNGAGKTTLFTAIRICLYGYMSMGYKNYNAYYIRAITKLLNNNAKLVRPTLAEVSLHIELINGQDVDNYILTRSWTLTESLFENFIVYKNNIKLSEDSIGDFEKYLLSIIPPELFNLYFFDGEKIADFFLEEGNNLRIKDAFLTLCGYDTFDIMRRNFKRISGNERNSAPVLEDYIKAKEELSETKKLLETLQQNLTICLDNLSNCNASLDILEKEYKQKGGITELELNNKISLLKEEEKKRENYNAALKKCANEIVPFLMLTNKLIQIKTQIEKEDNALKYFHFCEILEQSSIRNLIKKDLEKIKQIAFLRYGTEQQSILNLSSKQNAIVSNQIDKILLFNKNSISDYKNEIEKSLDLSAKIRKELELSNISTVQSYMQRRAELFEEKSNLLSRQVELESKLNSQNEKLKEIEKRYDKIQASLEEEFKKFSIVNISSRAIVMLDKLQEILYRKQIEKVEKFFRIEISKLMRKTNFIDDIYIDNNFNVHIYHTRSFDSSKIVDLLLSNSYEQLVNLFGIKAIHQLQMIAGTHNIDEIISFLQTSNMKTLSLPLEIDKFFLSNGEKQIFIMTLYHSLIKLCKYELPFIIDTPFARIDTEHRQNISKYFFKQLKGQIFILSTDEEITKSHVQILQDKIASTFILKNTDSKQTIIEQNSYFKV